MFTQHGFDGVSMDQIAAEAGVSKLTVYSHFGDKDALFVAAVRAQVRGAAAAGRCSRPTSRARCASS